jgi:hypothetical protein
MTPEADSISSPDRQRTINVRAFRESAQGMAIPPLAAFYLAVENEGTLIVNH